MLKIEKETNLSDFVYYDILSPTFLRWKYCKGGNVKGTSFKRLPGDVAGYINKTAKYKYARIRIDGDMYLVHRVVWMLHNGKIPPNLCIDHIDGDKLNNNISNLRLITTEGNNRNRNKDSRNLEGHTGVRWCVIRGKTVCVAYCTHPKPKRQQQVGFTVSKYGLLPAFKMAVEWRNKKLQEINEKIEFKYTELHMKGSINGNNPSSNNQDTARNP